MKTTIDKSELTLAEKIAEQYGVKTQTHAPTVKQVDLDERTIKAVGNTYFYIDSDMDMLVPGCAIKSINDKGPDSNATAKIKHQLDHVLRASNAAGRITVLDERKVDGNDVLYFESFIPQTLKGDEILTNYQEGIYDNHSIGFRYVQLEIAKRFSEVPAEIALWNEFFPKAINPEVAEARGFFWVVKEIELFEISTVSFGANTLTPFLGSKSKEDVNQLKKNLILRIDSLTDQLKSKVDKPTRKTVELEARQLKQIVSDLSIGEPSEKSTIKPDNKDTQGAGLIDELSDLI